MLADLNNSYVEIFAAARQQLPLMGYLLLYLWLINIINWILRSPLNRLGIYPRSAWGLLGIIFSPLLHADFNHLFFNCIPFFVLGMFILALGPGLFIGVTVLIILLQGILVWLCGRKYLHIGASGVISGYFGFILSLAYFYPTIISLILAFVAIYYFGSIMLGVFPTAELISWEAHLAGLISGILIAYVLYNYPAYELLLEKAFNFG